MWDLNVIIKDGKSYGLGTVYKSDSSRNPWRSESYQSRIPSNLKTDGAIYDNLGEGKMYVSEHSSALASVNKILNFWFIRSIPKIPPVKSFKSIRLAILTGTWAKDTKTGLLYLIYKI